MNILLLNAHSPQNAGDLAILQETLRCLQTAFPSCHITVAINDPQDDLLPPEAEYVPSLTRWLVTLGEDGSWRWHKPMAAPLTLWLFVAALLYRLSGRELLPRTNSRQALMRAYYEADVVVVIGGGHLYAPHAFNIAYLWLWVGLAAALAMGKPLVLLPQSFGPLPGRFQQALLGWLINRSALVAAREYRSVELLAKCNTRRPVLVLPDLAFATKQAAQHELDRVLPWLRSLRNCGVPIVGVTLMDWGGQNARFQQQARYETAMVDLIEYLVTTYNAHVILFAQCTGPTVAQDDRRIARRVHATVLHPNVHLADVALSPNLLKAAYSALDALVATRMHSAIFGLSANVPTLVIGYLHKSIGIMEMLGLADYALDIADVDVEKCRAAFDKLWASRLHVQMCLEQRMSAVEATLANLPSLVRQVRW